MNEPVRAMMFLFRQNMMGPSDLMDMLLCMPRDSVIIDIRQEYARMELGFVVKSEYFDPVSPGEILPIVKQFMIRQPFDQNAIPQVRYRCEWRWCE